MDGFIKLLDKNLDYLEHEITDNEVIIYVTSNRKEVHCPYCGNISRKVHSIYERSFQDLPVLGMKTRIVITNRKMFCLIQNVVTLLSLKHLTSFHTKGKKRNDY